MSLNISSRGSPYIIAEAATNHASRIPEERLDRALVYVQAAAECGADAVKFQMFKSPIANDMFCWIDGDWQRQDRWALSELSFNEWQIVKQEAEAREIDFLASAFQHCTVDWLRDLDVVASKVASRATKGFPYRAAPRPWLISTGMWLPHPSIAKDDDAFLIECESLYPSTMAWSGKYPGFSDHSANPDRAIDAMQRGCKLIEVHFYVRAEDAGPDRPASLTMDQLKQVTYARDQLKG